MHVLWERFLDSRDLQFAHFVRKHLIHNFFDVDGRVARSMRSLLRRGTPWATIAGPFLR